MKRGIRTPLAGALAAITLGQASVVHAQQACVAQQDLADATIYAMPLIVEAVQTKCTAELSPEGFVARESGVFVAPYLELQEQSWPATARVLTAFADREGGQADSGMSAIASIFTQESSDVVRPFVDATIRTLIGAELKPEDCGKVERGMELLAPLPPENAGGLVTFMVDLADVKNPELCPLEEE